jgi:predicted DsbA family dithiol-disulfide isomerase
VLERRYGDEFSRRLATMFAEAGLPFKADLDKVPNSRGALILGELARDRGVYPALHPRLFDAYWARGRDIGDPHVLVEEGTAVGLDEPEIEAALGDPAYAERVAGDTEAAIELGASGVPAWVIDKRVLVPGAQPHDVFEHVLGRLGYEPAAG